MYSTHFKELIYASFKAKVGLFDFFQVFWDIAQIYTAIDHYFLQNSPRLDWIEDLEV